MTKLLVLLLTVFFVQGCASTGMKAVSRAPSATEHSEYPFTFFSTPEDGHQHFIDAIENARSSIVLEMFHMTDPKVFSALSTKPASVDISLILDHNELKGNTLTATNQLKEGHPNIHVYPSSTAFNLTHTKAMIIDGKTAFITTVNLTTQADITRDYGLITEDPHVESEMQTMFNFDIGNSKTNSKNPDKAPTEPTNSPSSLIWSPLNSEEGIANLIAESESLPAEQKYIRSTVESIGDPVIEAAFEHAAQNGVEVDLIVPMCTENPNVLIAYTHIKEMPHVHIKMAPHPSTAAQPYMHGKMIFLGNGRGYLGSVNFSKNSTHGDRELGIIFTDMNVKNALEELFHSDWNVAVDSNEPEPTAQFCHSKY